MKLIKIFSALALAFALITSPAWAAEHKQANCCKKAADEGKKACSHKCCVAAAKEGKECEKCEGSGDIPKKKDKKDEKKTEKKAEAR